tara:strand:+ start:4039 stop:7230 length:3192 start_codon:yes stop_codon:yes gene_type:complete
MGKKSKIDTKNTQVGEDIVDIYSIKDAIKRAIHNSMIFKTNNIMTINEFNIYNQALEENYIKIKELEETLDNEEESYNDIKKYLIDIYICISKLFSQFGCYNIADFYLVYFGTMFNNCSDMNILLANYFHPYKIHIHKWETGNNGKHIGTREFSKLALISETDQIQYLESYQCLDLSRISQKFYERVNGLRLIIQDVKNKETLIFDGVMDNHNIEYFENSFVLNKLINFTEYIQAQDKSCYENNDFLTNFKNSLMIKDLLVYSLEELEIKYVRFLSKSQKMIEVPVGDIVNEFTNEDLYSKRVKLITLLIRYEKVEYQYLAYLLYDMLSNSASSGDSFEQNLLYESFPWTIKKYFKDAMKQTIDYTTKLCDYEVNVPLEQQICLMKASEAIKQKAMVKLKEVKSKNEESGSKARQWLEGLLKIPFGVFKQEPVLKIFQEIKETHNELLQVSDIKSDHNIIEIKKYIDENNISDEDLIVMKTHDIKTALTQNKRTILVTLINQLNSFSKARNIVELNKICHSGKTIDYMKSQIDNYLQTIKKHPILINDLHIALNLKTEHSQRQSLMSSISDKCMNINASLKKIDNVLEDSIHGHNNAKRQIKRIIGQWITGENTGYCFGFEGPPGVGKTSLAKNGLANCLKDYNNVSRPFGFIAVGGSSNSSTLSGHNYTYLGSTWGRIVDILMEKKCMNPIIFIDELDKVSRTEQGKEIVSILTHLVDSTQNDSFHDKYFNGIDVDLSKALFIFSYNDASLIDSILLDRIHRIKFEHLSLEEKLVIVYKHILPDLYVRIGIKNVIDFSKEVITYIIEEYTCEPGVRKLKEILFEIVSEINLSILHNETYELPIKITKEDIKFKYLKDRNSVKHKEIHKIAEIGNINGLWANAVGMGGIIPIQAKCFPAGNLMELKLTGMQGDVMKESMNVAKTLAWSLCDEKTCVENVKRFEETKRQGLHIHCPEGATPKDGPSAGVAITIVIYSLLNNLPIKNDIAITGEINLQGYITAIGGLDLKILGGIQAGVKHFIFPLENKDDFEKCKTKQTAFIDFDKYTFTMVSRIEEVIKIVFE